MRTLVQADALTGPQLWKRGGVIFTDPTDASLFSPGGVLNRLMMRRQRGGLPVHALNNTAFYRGIQLKTEVVSTPPVRLVERATKKDVTAHPAYQVLQNPNDEQTGVEFFEMMLCNLFTTGACFAEKIIKRGDVVQLLPIATSRMQPLRDRNGELYYQFTPRDGRAIDLPARIVLRVKLFGQAQGNPENAISPAWAAERAICLAAAQEGLLLDSAEDGGQKIIIKLPPEAALERMKAIGAPGLNDDMVSIQGQIEGAKSRMALYLPAGYDGTPMAANMGDMQVAETREMAVADIARIVGVPLSKLNVMGKSQSGATAEEQSLAWFQDSLRPVIVKLEKRLEADLLSPSDQQRYQIKFNVAAILRGDITAQTESLLKRWQSGAITTDEWRDYDDLPPFKDGRSNKPQYPVNMTTENVAGGAQNTNPAAGGVPGRSRNELPETHRRSLEGRLQATRQAAPLFREAVGRITRKEKAIIGRLLTAARGKRAEVSDLEERLKELYSLNGELRQFIQKNIASPVEFLFEAIRAAMEGELADAEIDDAELRNIVKRYIDIWARDYAESSENQIMDLIRSGTDQAEVIDAIDQRLNEWEEKRPDKETTEETNRGRNVFAKALYTLAGVSLLRWITTGTPCPLCDPLHDRTFKADSIPDCPLHRGCQCSYTSA